MKQFLNFFLTCIVIPCLFFLFLETSARVFWAISTEMKFGYYRQYKWNHDYEFKVGELKHQKARDQEGKGTDILIALRTSKQLPVSVTSLFSDLDWRDDEKILVDSLNQILNDSGKREKFIQTYQDNAREKNPEIASLLKKDKRRAIENKRLARLMMEALFPVKEKFPYAYYSRHYPMDVLFHGKKSVISLMRKTPGLDKIVSPQGLQLVALGGSTVACSGVNPSQCWTAFLQERLDRYQAENPDFPKSTVLNLGRSAGSSRDSQQALFIYLRKYPNASVDYILWYEGLNDIHYRIQKPHLADHVTHGIYGDSKMKTANLEINDSVFYRTLLFLDQNSALVHALVRLKESLLKKSSPEEPEPELPPSQETLTDREEAIRKTAELNYQHLNEIKHLAKKGLFLFSIPLPKKAVDRRYHSDYDAKEKMFRHLESYAKRDGHPFGDVAPKIESQNVSDVFTVDHVHLNGYGNFLLAEAIFEFILPKLESDLRKN